MVCDHLNYIHQAKIGMCYQSFDNTYQFLLDEYNSDDRIPYDYIQNGEMYNFWRDDSNVRGVWRKTSIESYQAEEIEWENILDIDQLAN